MDTLQYIPRIPVGEPTDPDDPRRPCNCKEWGPVFASATAQEWRIGPVCAHVGYLIAHRVIPYAGVTEASAFEFERKVAEFTRNHPHLARTHDAPLSMSGPLPARMRPEDWPGCTWAGWGRWDGPGPKPRPMGPVYECNLKRPFRPTETRYTWDIEADPGDPPGTPFSTTDTSRAAWPLPPLE